MVSSLAARRLALALPGVIEQDHHGFPSYRVDGKIFATLPDDRHLHVMLAEDRIREAVLADPAACAEKWWGKKLAAVRVSLADIGESALEALLTEAWRRRAPWKLARIAPIRSGNPEEPAGQGNRRGASPSSREQQLAR